MKNIAQYIDHTLLKPDATPEQIEKVCNEALTHKFAAVCVNSSHVFLCAKSLSGSDVKVCSVVGFPLGAMHTEAKIFETECAIEEGADEIDMVIPVGFFKAGERDYVKRDIRAVVDVAHEYNAIVKVIIETALLTTSEKTGACRLAVEARADFVKTSTGFSKGGATIEDVKLMRETVGPDVGVKAAGGIKNYADAMAMIEAGANRLGCSAGVAIAEEAEKTGGVTMQWW